MTAAGDRGEPHLRDDGTLFAPRFDDVYFQADGLAEARHVFLEGNALAERFARGGDVAIGETGFGTGLGFLATWDLFRRVAPGDARLCFTSIEGFPLPPRTARAALSRFPELTPLVDTLLDGWDADARGLVRRAFDGGRVVLCNLFGDVSRMLDAHRFRVDAWFLDGFAPARNPAMWSEPVLRAVAARTRRGGTLATFTVAGAVRRALAGAGFEVATRTGFGPKREMLTGRMVGTPPDPTAPWLRLPDLRRPRRVTVVGAGLAGAGAARALAERGVDVTVVDTEGVAAGASGHGLAVLQPRLGPEPDARLVAHAFRWTRDLLGRAAPDLVVPCGVLQPAVDATSAATLRARLDAGGHAGAEATWIDGTECDIRSGVRLGALGGAWLPGAAVVRAAALCARLLEHPRIEVRRADASDVDGSRVLAHALGARAALDFLPMQASRGQLTLLEGAADSAPRCVVSHGGTVTPAVDGVRAVGATYGIGDEDASVRDADDAVNLARFRTAFPALEPALCAPRRGSWAGVRATTSDRLPYVGPLPDADAFDRAYASAWRGGRSRGLPEPEFAPDLLVSLAHGSRGVATGPFCGELLAAMVCAEPLPLEDDLLRRVLPVRALVRRAQRGR